MTAKSLATGVVGDAAVVRRPPPRLCCTRKPAGSRACLDAPKALACGPGAATIVAALRRRYYLSFKRSSPRPVPARQNRPAEARDHALPHQP